MKITSNRPIRFVGWIIGTIVLGAIGSGIWERLFSQYTDVILDLFVKVYSKISTGYLDSIYEQIGKGSYGLVELDNYFLIQIVGIFWYPIFLLIVFLRFSHIIFPKYIKSNSEEIQEEKIQNEDSSKGSKMLRISFLFVLFTYPFLFIAQISQFVSKLTAIKTVIKIEKSIDIVSPYIDDQELKLLRSEYRQIETYVDYLEYVSKLKSLDDKIEEIELKDFLKD